ncbi:DUF4168 domain-containing protein [Zunongwangia endophytica]|uniref:DUF4168 domain-containing protein n=1 Tax=Zunongwangia endophytica TaxID=1808945 RepID=A0ABV8H786_9FLAO|nr:DUF4168 domain-containing protein [Zunongwangia endophytica]MDN3594765.1 DUF4168 domain-containing protein [Zunongwangia endophytica]
MLKSKKIAGLLFAFALTAGTAAVAQTPTTQQQQQTVDVDVSDAELSKFAKAYQGLRMMNQQVNQKMMKTVQDGGMDVQRFNEIHQASQDPNKEVEATDEELDQHATILTEIESMQGDFQKKMETTIKDQGLTVERYQKLAMALQSDQELQSRLQKMMQQG